MSLEQPGWLVLLLLLPLLATGAAMVSHTRARQWSAFVADRLRTKLLRRSSPVPRWIAFTCLLLAVALLLIALARPLSRKGSTHEEVLGRNILFALDLSRSMKTRDLSPDRLSQAKAVCFDLLDSMPTDRVGVVGFAGTPYLFAPLTVDHANVRETIAQLDIDWIPTGGSDLESGLRLAIETLKETGTRPNALILLSDGEENEGDIAELAADARDAGIEVIAIGFGTPDGDFVPDPRNPDIPYRDRAGNEVLSRLESQPLQRLATVTGGRFAIARSGADIPHMVRTAISDLEQVRITGTQRTITVEYFQWFVLPAILLLIAAVTAATRWRGVGARVAPLALVLGVALPDPARGAVADDARAALAEKRYEDAAEAFSALAEQYRDREEGFRFSLAAGEAAYRQQDWPAAREAFSQAMRSEDSTVRHAAHHGLGNVLFQIGWERLSGGPAYPETTDESAADSEPGEGLEAFRRLFDALLGRDNDDEGDEDEEMAAFEEMVRQRLTEWMTESSESDSPPEGAERFNGALTDWIDAVKHFDAAPGVAEAGHNRALTVKHLKKLKEMLDTLEENAEALQAVPQSEGEGQQQQEGQPSEQEGEGEPREDGSGSGGEQEREGEGSEGEEENERGGDQQDEQQPPDDGSGDPEEEDSGGDDSETEPKPGETREEAARRILGENSDLQKGALSPGRIRYRQLPDKDW